MTYRGICKKNLHMPRSFSFNTLLCWRKTLEFFPSTRVPSSLAVLFASGAYFLCILVFRTANFLCSCRSIHTARRFLQKNRFPCHAVSLLKLYSFCFLFLYKSTIFSVLFAFFDGSVHFGMPFASLVSMNFFHKRISSIWKTVGGNDI